MYYSLYPQRLAETVLGRTMPAAALLPEGTAPRDGQPDAEEECAEDVAALAQRLGAKRPVLFRNLTPPGVAMERLDWCVLRVVVPGLQPLHGHHALPFLGGPLWAPRGWKDWADMPPHPFP